VNRGLLGRPFGLPDWPGFQGRRFLRLAAFGINSENTTGSLFHHCSRNQSKRDRRERRAAGSPGLLRSIAWVVYGPTSQYSGVNVAASIQLAAEDFRSTPRRRAVAACAHRRRGRCCVSV